MIALKGTRFKVKLGVVIRKARVDNEVVFAQFAVCKSDPQTDVTEERHMGLGAYHD